MISIKINCACGQRYAFDVEPVQGLMPHAVACPVCNADGTASANAMMAQSLSAPAPVAPARAGGLRLRGGATESSATPAVTGPSTPRAASRYPALLPGQISRDQAVNEARAKMMWGDEPQQVVKFLMIQGYSAQEASELVHEMHRERLATLRSDGIKKIVFGVAMVCVPIGSYIFFASLGYLPLKLLAVTVMVGLYGAYQAVNGTFMLVAPKAVRGDAAEQ